MLTLTLLLCACGQRQTTDGIGAATFAPCSAEGSLFETIPFDEWPAAYHSRVSAAVEKHIESLSKYRGEALRCTEEDYASIVPPSGDLQAIAVNLPAWEDPDDLAKLSESHLSTVLLEFLRVYECSLLERDLYDEPIVGDGDWGQGKNEDNVADWGKLALETGRQRDIIGRELATARPVLERTLTLVGSFDRLQPLSIDIECLKRSSLDLRNVLGLTAEASACLPRIEDGRGSLRDIKEDDDE